MELAGAAHVKGDDDDRVLDYAECLRVPALWSQGRIPGGRGGLHWPRRGGAKSDCRTQLGDAIDVLGANRGHRFPLQRFFQPL